MDDSSPDIHDDARPGDEGHRTTPEPEPQDQGAPEDTGDPVGDDNIRDGTVGGLMGGARQSQGQGQGG
jgi:hypothetical protein